MTRVATKDGKNLDTLPRDHTFGAHLRNPSGSQRQTGPERGAYLRSHSSLEVCWDKVLSYVSCELLPPHVIPEKEQG